jgi:hypothetical protein
MNHQGEQVQYGLQLLKARDCMRNKWDTFAVLEI